MTNDRLSNFTFFIALFIFAIFVFMRIGAGYGYDIDTYDMLRTWQYVIYNHEYLPSRFQGYIVAEFIIGLSASLGGALASNLAVLAFSICGMIATFLIAKELKVDRPLLVVAAMMSNPFIAIASSTSMDYMIAYALFSFGILLYLKGALLLSVVFLASACGARLPYFLISMFAVGSLIASSNLALGRKCTEIFVFSSVLFFISGLFYLPVWIAHGLDFSWLDAALPDEQGFFGLVVRFIYKLTYLFGPLAALLIFIILGYYALFRRSYFSKLFTQDRRTAFLLSISVIFANLLIFLRAPIEISYLIPIVPFVAILFLTADLRQLVYVMIIGGIFHSLIRVQVLETEHRPTGDCGPTQAIGAQPTLELTKGKLLRELDNLELQEKCNKIRLIVPYEHHNDPLP
jgi:hypothetical protein